jgi:hypothetical protein
MGEGSCANRERAPAAGGVYCLRNPRASPLWQCAKRAPGALCGLVFQPRARRTAKARNDRGAPTATLSEFAQRARAAWARLIRKVYEADPLQCPKCKGPMRVVALIDDPGVIRHILEHLGLWAPEASERGPPARLEEQKGRHQGGAKWIGTGGISPFGAYGYNPEGVRIGQESSRNRAAVKVWDQREYRNLDDSVESAHAISRSL